MSSEGDLLFGSGACRHIVTSWFGQGILWGVSKVMRHHVETGKARFDEWSHMAMGMRFRAGAMGVPFMPIRSMLGSDVGKLRPEAKEIDCPFTGEKLLLVPALNPDVALIHVQRCDAYGNAQMDGLQFMDIDLALAADRVILTTERIVSNDQIRRAPDQTKIPFFCGRRGGRGAVRLRAARMLRRLRADDPAPGGLCRAGEQGPGRGHAAVSRALRLRAEIMERLPVPDRDRRVLEASPHGRSIYND